MAFTHLQGTSNNAGAASSFTMTLTSSPTTGSVLIVGIAGSNSVGITSVSDGTNTYTKLTQSVFNANAGYGEIFYLIAPAGAGKTVTVTCAGTANSVGWFDEFGVSGGTASFDNQNTANNTSSGVTSINTPTLAVAGSGELVYAVWGCAGTASSAGAFTLAQGGVIGGDLACYLLSSGSGTITPNATQTSAQGYSGAIASFKITASGGTPPLSWLVQQPEPIRRIPVLNSEFAAPVFVPPPPVVPNFGWFIQQPEPIRRIPVLNSEFAAPVFVPPPIVVPSFAWFVQWTDPIRRRPTAMPDESTHAFVFAQRFLQSLSGGLTFSGALAEATTYHESLSGGITPAGALTKQTNKGLSGGLTPSGAITNKQTNKNLTGASLTPSGSLAESFVGHQSLSGTLTFSGALSAVFQAGGNVFSWLGRTLAASWKRGG